jgi:hypothetical protein
MILNKISIFDTNTSEWLSGNSLDHISLHSIYILFTCLASVFFFETRHDISKETLNISKLEFFQHIFEIDVIHEQRV